jgi:hypothetical protein
MCRWGVGEEEEKEEKEEKEEEEGRVATVNQRKTL